MPDNSPFFIIGAGRSGTTLLRLILTGHSRLHIPPETRFIRSLVRELPLAGELTPAQVDRAVTVMIEDYRWPDMDITVSELRGWAADLRSPRLVDIINLVYKRHCVRAGKPRFGDKTPIYFEIVRELSVLYPGAKFIHLIRDGRDVAISRIDLDWDRYYARNRFEWTLAMARRREYIRSSDAGNVLEVRYEDLVSDVGGTIRQVCAFLDEQFEPPMLDWQQLSGLVPARERHIHGKLGQRMSNDNIAVWRHRLSAFECFAIEACLYRDLELLGYELRYSRALWRPLLCVTGGLLGVAAPLIERSVRSLKRHKMLRTTICL